jgi:carboxynorspermidine decarboxylase
MFSVFPSHAAREDGCCASSVHEARLGRETFGGEVHRLRRRLLGSDRREIAALADHVTLNSFAAAPPVPRVVDESGHAVTCGLRINPAALRRRGRDLRPLRPAPPLASGVRRAAFAGETLHGVTGLHAHTLCEQDAAPFARTLAAIEQRFGDLLPRLAWIQFRRRTPHHAARLRSGLLCGTLAAFRARHPNIGTVYLEPGEACALNAGTLAATVLDVVENDMPIAILDAIVRLPHAGRDGNAYRPRSSVTLPGAARPNPDRTRPRLRPRRQGPPPCGSRVPPALRATSSATGRFDTPLGTGDRVIFEDMAHYTMVKTNTFNGIRLPSIMLREPEGTLRTVRAFGYQDFKTRLS